MTSLGRLIFFDQPGTGGSDPVTPGALPTLESWADSITAVLDDLGSREAVLLASTAALPAALFAATHPSRATALVVLEGYAHPLTESHGVPPARGSRRDVGHGGACACLESGHAVERGDSGSVGSDGTP
jgi:pimeloyl-ACP methyl ester carboxylesterase